MFHNLPEYYPVNVFDVSIVFTKTYFILYDNITGSAQRIRNPAS